MHPHHEGAGLTDVPRRRPYRMICWTLPLYTLTECVSFIKLGTEYMNISHCFSLTAWSEYVFYRVQIPIEMDFCTDLLIIILNEMSKVGKFFIKG